MLLTDPSECTLSHTPYGSTNQSLPCCLHATHQPIRVQLVPYTLLSTLTGFQMAVPMPGTHKRRKMTSKLAQMQNICKVPQTEHSASLLSTQRMVAHGDKQYFLKVAVLKCWICLRRMNSSGTSTPPWEWNTSLLLRGLHFKEGLKWQVCKKGKCYSEQSCLEGWFGGKKWQKIPLVTLCQLWAMQFAQTTPPDLMDQERTRAF